MLDAQRIGGIGKAGACGDVEQPVAGSVSEDPVLAGSAGEQRRVFEPGAALIGAGQVGGGDARHERQPVAAAIGGHMGDARGCAARIGDGQGDARSRLGGARIDLVDARQNVDMAIVVAIGQHFVAAQHAGCHDEQGRSVGDQARPSTRAGGGIEAGGGGVDQRPRCIDAEADDGAEAIDQFRPKRQRRQADTRSRHRWGETRRRADDDQRAGNQRQIGGEQIAHGDVGGGGGGAGGMAQDQRVGGDLAGDTRRFRDALVDDQARFDDVDKGVGIGGDAPGDRFAHRDIGKGRIELVAAGKRVAGGDDGLHDGGVTLEHDQRGRAGDRGSAAGTGKLIMAKLCRIGQDAAVHHAVGDPRPIDDGKALPEQQLRPVDGEARCGFRHAAAAKCGRRRPGDKHQPRAERVDEVEIIGRCGRATGMTDCERIGEDVAGGPRQCAAGRGDAVEAADVGGGFHDRLGEGEHRRDQIDAGDRGQRCGIAAGGGVVERCRQVEPVAALVGGGVERGRAVADDQRYGRGVGVAGDRDRAEREDDAVGDAVPVRVDRRDGIAPGGKNHAAQRHRHACRVKAEQPRRDGQIVGDGDIVRRAARQGRRQHDGRHFADAQVGDAGPEGGIAGIGVGGAGDADRLCQCRGGRRRQGDGNIAADRRRDTLVGTGAGEAVIAAAGGIGESGTDDHAVGDARCIGDRRGFAGQQSRQCDGVGIGEVCRDTAQRQGRAADRDQPGAGNVAQRQVVCRAAAGVGHRDGVAELRPGLARCRRNRLGEGNARLHDIDADRCGIGATAIVEAGGEREQVAGAVAGAGGTVGAIKGQRRNGDGDRAAGAGAGDGAEIPEQAVDDAIAIGVDLDKRRCRDGGGDAGAQRDDRRPDKLQKPGGTGAEERIADADERATRRHGDNKVVEQAFADGEIGVAGAELAAAGVGKAAAGNDLVEVGDADGDGVGGAGGAATGTGQAVVAGNGGVGDRGAGSGAGSGGTDDGAIFDDGRLAERQYRDTDIDGAAGNDGAGTGNDDQRPRDQRQRAAGKAIGKADVGGGGGRGRGMVRGNAVGDGIAGGGTGDGRRLVDDQKRRGDGDRRRGRVGRVAEAGRGDGVVGAHHAVLVGGVVGNAHLQFDHDAVVRIGDIVAGVGDGAEGEGDDRPAGDGHRRRSRPEKRDQPRAADDIIKARRQRVAEVERRRAIGQRRHQAVGDDFAHHDIGVGVVADRGVDDGLVDGHRPAGDDAGAACTSRRAAGGVAGNTVEADAGGVDDGGAEHDAVADIGLITDGHGFAGAQRRNRDAGKAGCGTRYGAGKAYRPRYQRQVRGERVGDGHAIGDTGAGVRDEHRIGKPRPGIDDAGGDGLLNRDDRFDDRERRNGSGGAKAEAGGCRVGDDGVGGGVGGDIGDQGDDPDDDAVTGADDAIGGVGDGAEVEGRGGAGGVDRRGAADADQRIGERAAGWGAETGVAADRMDRRRDEVEHIGAAGQQIDDAERDAAFGQHRDDIEGRGFADLHLRVGVVVDRGGDQRLRQRHAGDRQGGGDAWLVDDDALAGLAAGQRRIFGDARGVDEGGAGGNGVADGRRERDDDVAARRQAVGGDGDGAGGIGCRRVHRAGRSHADDADVGETQPDQVAVDHPNVEGGRRVERRGVGQRQRIDHHVAAIGAGNVDRLGQRQVGGADDDAAVGGKHGIDQRAGLGCRGEKQAPAVGKDAAADVGDNIGDTRHDLDDDGIVVGDAIGGDIDVAQNEIEAAAGNGRRRADNRHAGSGYAAAHGDDGGADRRETVAAGEKVAQRDVVDLAFGQRVGDLEGRGFADGNRRAGGEGLVGRIERLDDAGVTRRHGRCVGQPGGDEIGAALQRRIAVERRGVRPGLARLNAAGGNQVIGDDDDIGRRSADADAVGIGGERAAGAVGQDDAERVGAEQPGAAAGIGKSNRHPGAVGDLQIETGRIDGDGKACRQRVPDRHVEGTVAAGAVVVDGDGEGHLVASIDAGQIGVDRARRQRCIGDVAGERCGTGVADGAGKADAGGAA